MRDVTSEGLLCRINIMVGESKLFAGLLNDGSDLWVVRLNHAGKEMVSRLMVECPSEDSPKPTTCCVVLGRGNLHLCPIIVRRGGKKGGGD